MNICLLWVLILSATTAYGNDFKIVETDKGIYVEYIGTPADRDSETQGVPTSEPTINPTDVKHPSVLYEKPLMRQIRAITNQVEQLKREADEALQRTGTETAEDIKAKEALAAEKRLQIEKQADEIQRITGNRPNLNLLFNPANKSKSRRQRPL